MQLFEALLHLLSPHQRDVVAAGPGRVVAGVLQDVVNVELLGQEGLGGHAEAVLAQPHLGGFIRAQLELS